jgi:hypothetical protein
MDMWNHISVLGCLVCACALRQHFLLFRIRVVQRKQFGGASVCFSDEEKLVLSSVVGQQGLCSWFLSDLEEIIGFVLIQSVSDGISKS